MARCFEPPGCTTVTVGTSLSFLSRYMTVDHCKRKAQDTRHASGRYRPLPQSKNLRLGFAPNSVFRTAGSELVSRSCSLASNVLSISILPFPLRIATPPALWDQSC